MEKDSIEPLQFELEDKEQSNDTDPFHAALSTTAQAFTHRIQRKIHEKEQSNIIAEEAAKIRHNTLLNALLNIRRALTDVTKIDLGERFRFELTADDHSGWPRLTINLLDNVMRAAHYPMLQVTAHDRNQLAIIEIKFDSIKPAEQISLANSDNLSPASMLLKRCVRSYLDIIAELIVKAELNSVETVDSRNLIDSRISTAILAATHNAEENHDFFAEHLEDVIDTLPEIDSILHLKLDEDF